MSSTKKANRTDYGLVLALICIALALLVAKYLRQEPSVEFPSAIASDLDERK